MRVFIGLSLSSEIRAALASVYFETSHIRWTPPENLHLTLKFIGEILEGDLCALAAELDDIEQPAFGLTIQGWGAFPNRNHPNDIWAGVKKSQPFMHLHDHIEQVCQRIGFKKDQRPFSPHITLARGRKNSEPLKLV